MLMQAETTDETPRLPRLALAALVFLLVAPLIAAPCAVLVLVLAHRASDKFATVVAVTVIAASIIALVGGILIGESAIESVT